MIFYSFFKTLVGSVVSVELKNDLIITGSLQSVDQFLNIKLENISVEENSDNPFLGSVKNTFIRGYITLPAHEIDTELLEDAARKENSILATVATK